MARSLIKGAPPLTRGFHLWLLGLLPMAILFAVAAWQLPSNNREVTGNRAIGVAQEVRLPGTLINDPDDVPRPAPLLTLAMVEGDIWLPTWLPSDVEGEPTVARYRTDTGHEVTEIWFQARRTVEGQAMQGVIVQLDGVEGQPLVYDPPRLASEWDDGTMANRDLEAAQIASEAADAAASESAARYSTSQIQGQQAETIQLSNLPNFPMVQGIRWSVGATHFYVGGTFSWGEIQQVADGLRPSVQD